MVSPSKTQVTRPVMLTYLYMSFGLTADVAEWNARIATRVATRSRRNDTNTPATMKQGSPAMVMSVRRSAEGPSGSCAEGVYLRMDAIKVSASVVPPCAEGVHLAVWYVAPKFVWYNAKHRSEASTDCCAYAVAAGAAPT